MAMNFKFPDVGEGIHEGKLVKWRVKEGDEIKADAILCEVETDKAVVEIPAPRNGVVLKLYHNEGDTIKVGETLVTIGDRGEDIIVEEIKQPEAPKPQVQKQSAATIPTIQPSSIPSGVIAAPFVRQKAKEMGIDLNKVKGSGPGGRILPEDLEKAAKEGVGTSSGASAAAGPSNSQVAPLQTDFSQFGEISKVKITGIRKRTSEVMLRSKHTAAHVTHFDEADVTLLAKLREEMKQIASQKGVKLTFMPLIIKAVVQSLQTHAKFNSSFDEANDEIIFKKYYNIGIAIDTPDGLIVPNIKEADKKDLMTLATELTRISNEAVGGKMKLDDMKGGSFSITNIGSIGGEFFTPIIYHPEVAILGIGRISDRVVVEDGKAVIAKKLPLSLSFDHRVIDGAEAARFVNDIIKLLENPENLK